MSDPQLKRQPRTLCEHFSQWEEYEGVIFYDEFDAAFVGFACQFNVGPIAVYDQRKVIEILVASGDEDSESPYEDALDHFGFNVMGSYVGERTPIFLTYEEDGAVEDIVKRQAGAELSGWSREIAAEGVTEVS